MFYRFFASVGLSLVATATFATTLTVTTLTDYEPFTFGPTDPVLQEAVEPGADSASLRGYTWDVVREAFHAMDEPVSLNVVPWSRGVNMLENGGTSALFPTLKTETRMAAGYVFSENPVHSMEINVYVGADSEFNWDGDMATLSTALQGQRIGVRNGYSYGDWWSENSASLDASISATKSSLQNFRKLQAGRLDVIIGYDVPTSYELSKHGMTGLLRNAGRISIATEYLSAHTSSGGSEAVRIFDAGYAIIASNGTLDRIRLNWGQ